MNIKRHIIFVPGKNPKPPAQQHQHLLWRTLVEGVHRAEPELANKFSQHENDFSIIPWNPIFYHEVKDISIDLPWIDTLLNTHGPTEDDIREAHHWHKKLSRAQYTLIDYVPCLIKFMPDTLRQTALELSRYFQNKQNIADEIREILKQQLRPLFASNTRILLIGHSLGSIIAYDALWELSHAEKLSGKVDLFLTLGSPLGMNYVRHRLLGASNTGIEKYPANIRHWANVSSVGDITALDRTFSDDFSDMIKLGIIEDIHDHCKDIYNFFRNDKGLNCHRSYGYLVNPAVGKIIADWWDKK
ncbi:MAG: GPI inositol-deacylase [Gammaproteobacteria bacterium]|nr:GPI inositol-deacylase [Gammaproteobacteria bacterium]